MAEVTVYDAVRMKAIEDASIVNGEIDPITGHLILTRFDGTEVDAGVVNRPQVWQKISGITLATAAATIDLTGIPATYESLQLRMRGKSANQNGIVNVYMSFNNDTSDALYETLTENVYGTGTVGSTVDLATGNERLRHEFPPQSSYAGNSWGSVICDILDYTKTGYKTYHSINDMAAATTPAADTSFKMKRIFGVWRNNAAINRITLTAATGTLAIGTTVSLYGMEAAV